MADFKFIQLTPREARGVTNLSVRVAHIVSIYEDSPSHKQAVVNTVTGGVWNVTETVAEVFARINKT